MALLGFSVFMPPNVVPENHTMSSLAKLAVLAQVMTSEPAAVAVQVIPTTEVT